MAPMQCRLGAPTRYLMAPGCRKKIAREAARFKGAKRWLIVTDPGLASLPWLEEMNLLETGSWRCPAASGVLSSACSLS